MFEFVLSQSIRNQYDRKVTGLTISLSFWLNRFYFFRRILCSCFLNNDLIICSLNEKFVLELKFEPSLRSSNIPGLPKLIGNGVEFLNRDLSSKMFCDRTNMVCLLDFLRDHHHNEKVTNNKTRIFLALSRTNHNERLTKARYLVFNCFLFVCSP